MPNPFDQLGKFDPKETSNPFNNLDGRNLSGYVPEKRAVRTNFRITEDIEDDRKNLAKIEADNKNVFKLAAKTLNPINLAKASWDLTKEVVANPLESAKNAALGISNSLTLGATDYFQRKAFINAATKGEGAMTKEEAESVARNAILPEDPEQRAIRGGAEFAGYVVPYAATEKLAMTGLKFAAPAFVKNYARLSKFLVDAGVFNAVGQVEESFNGATPEERKQRAIIDTSAAGLFGIAGNIFRRLRGTPFQSPFEVKPVTNVNSLVPEGIVVSENTLKEGATARLAELTSKKFLRGNEAKELNFLKKNIENPDALYAYNSNPPKMDIPVGDAKTAMTIEFPSTRAVVDEGSAAVSKGAAKTAEEGAVSKINVATNDMEALQNYIKGSNNIDYKVVENLGKDARGNPIQARFEAKGGKDGRPVIYVSDKTTASNLAHEMGHYFDGNLTKSVDRKLSSLLPDYENNRPMIEDTLGSLAVERLGGQASSEAISREISSMASAIRKETDALSHVRRGESIASNSEKFADAVSEILTRSGAAEEAPILTSLLRHSERANTSKLFGESVAKELKSVQSRIPDNVVSVGDKTFELSGESKARYLQAKQTSDSYINAIKERNMGERGQSIIKGEGMKMAALKRELTGQYTATEIRNLTDKEASNYIGKNVNVEINGKVVPATIETRSAFGNVKVKMENGDVISVKTSAVTDPRSKEEVLKSILEKPEAKVYEPQTIKNVLENPPEKVKVVEKPVEKIVEKAPELERTPTGKKPDTAAIRAEKITTNAETEKFINESVIPKVEGKYRIGKGNADLIERSMGSELTEESFDRILKERFGNLSEDIVKAKRIMTDGATNLKEQLAGRSIQDLSGQELKDVMGDYSRLIETFEVYSGVRTELSNSFRSLGLGVSPGENDVLRTALETIQKAIGSEKDPFKIMQKAFKVQEKGPVAKYFEVWYPALLSGPKTSIRNIVGNASNITLQTFSKMFTKEGRGEFFTTVNAMIGSHKEALNKAIAVLKGDENILSKITEAPIIAEKTFSGKFAFLNKMEYVGRFLNAQDAYFSTVAREGEIAAIRKGAFDYGLKDKAIIDAVNEGVGQGYAQMATFRNQFEKTFVGEIGSKVASLKQSENAGVRTVANFLTPFVRTVANITDRRLDFVPILNLARTFGARDLYEQRAGRILTDVGFIEKMMGTGVSREAAISESARVKEIIIDRLRNQQMGRFYMGLTTMAAGIPLALNGRVTGTGPTSKNERDTLMASGWRPNSIIMPDGTALPYQNLLSPLASILSVLGNVNDAVRYKSDKSTVTDASVKGMMNFMRSELDQSFLSGISNLYDGMTGYKPATQVFSELASNAIPIPAAWTQTKDILFPERYIAKDFNDIIKNKLGITGDFFGTGLTEPLQPNLNAFGDQVKADLIYGLTPPIINSKKDDPVLNFMIENGISIGKPQLSTKIEGRRGEKRELTPEEYTRYVKNSGAKIYDALTRRVESGYFDRYRTAEAKKDAMDKIVSDIRSKEKSKIRY